MRALGRLLWKDALVEARSFERLGTLVLFSIVVLLTLHFSLPADSPLRPVASAGFVWVSLVFAAILELRRSFDAERRDGTLDALRASPLEPSVLFVAKALSSLAVVGIVALLLVPLTALFFSARFGGIAAAYGVVVAGVGGLVAWGTLFGAVAGGARASDLVLPILLFPLLVPQTVAVVRLLAVELGGAPLAEAGRGFVLLAAFDVISWGTSLLLFEYVLDE